MHHRQRGVTFLGWLFLIIPLALVAYAGIRVAPVYMDDAKLRTVLQKTAQDFSGGGAVRREDIANSLSRRMQVEYLTVPTDEDINITRSRDGWVMEIAYERRAPLFRNLSVLAEFEHRVEIN